MSDPGEDIAQAIADYVGDPERGYSLQPEASVPEHPAEALRAEITRLRVIAFPVGETEEKAESRCRVLLSPEVNVIVTASAEAVGDRKAFNGFVREIRRSLRFEAMAGWTWLRSETITKYDPDLMGKESFLSAFTVFYLGIE